MASPIGDLGPCDVLFGVTDLGANGGVTFRHSDDVAEHHTAQYGTAMKDGVITGRSIEVEMTLKESSLAVLAAITSSSTLTGNELMIASPVGISLRTIALQLVLKPYLDNSGAATADQTKWLTFFVAAAEMDAEVVFDADSDRELTVKFHCFQATTVPSSESYAIGDIYAWGYEQTS